MDAAVGEARVTRAERRVGAVLQEQFGELEVDPLVVFAKVQRRMQRRALAHVLDVRVCAMRQQQRDHVATRTLAVDRHMKSCAVSLRPHDLLGAVRRRLTPRPRAILVIRSGAALRVHVRAGAQQQGGACEVPPLHERVERAHAVVVKGAARRAHAALPTRLLPRPHVAAHVVNRSGMQHTRLIARSGREQVSRGVHACR
mmetsp:Transcript_70719/g.194018  ORF Transcript_70719/g.194018 Transcript_70719/m.194018 type:complete len:200 (+) Transcript_70719:744-1343(+)